MRVVLKHAELGKKGISWPRTSQREIGQHGTESLQGQGRSGGWARAWSHICLNKFLASDLSWTEFLLVLGLTSSGQLSSPECPPSADLAEGGHGRGGF